MALASPTAETAAINAVTGLTTYVNLCSGSPGTTGANELTSTRQAITWTASTAGSAASNSSSISISLAASTTASYFGGWNAATAGTYEIGGALSPSVTTGTSAGTVTIAAAALTLSAS